MRVAYALDQPTLPQYTGEDGGDSSGYLAYGAGVLQWQGTRLYPGRTLLCFQAETGAAVYSLCRRLSSLSAGSRGDNRDTAGAVPGLDSNSLSGIPVGDDHRRQYERRDNRGDAGCAASGFRRRTRANQHRDLVHLLHRVRAVALYRIRRWARARLALASSRSGQRLGAIGRAFGLATLTRGVSALFPCVLALHLVWLGRRPILLGWRRHCLLLLFVYAAIVATWTGYNLANWNRFVIVSDQLMGALWRGAESRDGTPQQNDKLLMEGVEISTPADCEIDCHFDHAAATYVNKIGEIVSADPLGYLKLRFGELAYSILQPYGTAPFGDVSVFEAGRQCYWRSGRSAGLFGSFKLRASRSSWRFWVFHFVGIIFGLLGMLWARKGRITAAPAAGFAIYTLAIHVFLLALPRYLFPIELVWLVFAGIALRELSQRRRLGIRRDGN